MIGYLIGKNPEWSINGFDLCQMEPSYRCTSHNELCCQAPGHFIH